MYDIHMIQWCIICHYTSWYNVHSTYLLSNAIQSLNKNNLDLRPSNACLDLLHLFYISRERVRTFTDIKRYWTVQSKSLIHIQYLQWKPPSSAQLPWQLKMNQFAKLLPVENERNPANSAFLLLGNLKWRWEVNCITESVKIGISYWRWWFS